MLQHALEYRVKSVLLTVRNPVRRRLRATGMAVWPTTAGYRTATALKKV